MANLTVSTGTVSGLPGGQPVKVARSATTIDPWAQLRFRTNVSTGQIWPRGNYVAGQGWL